MLMWGGEGRRDTPLPAICLLALLSCLPAPGCSRKTGVEGSVRYAGGPLPGVFIEVYDRVPDGVASPVASANTGSGGRYFFTLPPGSYHLVARKQPQTGGGMLYGAGEALEVPATGILEAPPILLADQSGVGEPSGTGTRIAGRVVLRGIPLAGAYLYLYPEGRTRGPGFLVRVRSGKDGRFELAAAPGRYRLIARSRENGEAMGTLEEGDLVGEAGSVLEVNSRPFSVGSVPLRSVDPHFLTGRRWGGGGEGIPLSGRVTDEKGTPVAGVHAFLYRDHRMVGKPLALSAPTGADGRYRLSLPGPGTYFLGARSRYGGPVEPGEVMGVYEGDGSRFLRVEPGEPPPSPEIVVRETW